MEREDFDLCKRYIQSRAIERWVKPLDLADFADYPSEKLRREINHRYREGINSGQLSRSHNELITVQMRGRLSRINVKAPRVLVDWLRDQKDALEPGQFRKLLGDVYEAGIDPFAIDEDPPPTIEFRQTPPSPDAVDQLEEVAPTPPAAEEPDQAKLTPIEAGLGDQQSDGLGRGSELELRADGFVYVIRHITSGMIKIGITSNWPRRAEELRVGETTEPVMLIWSEDKLTVEQGLHAEFDTQRLPQSEWFHLIDTQRQRLLDLLMRQGEVMTPAEAAARSIQSAQ